MASINLVFCLSYLLLESERKEERMSSRGNYGLSVDEVGESKKSTEDWEVERTREGMKQSECLKLYWLYVKISFCSKQRQAPCAVGGQRRGGAAVQTQSVSNLASVIHRSQVMQAHSRHPTLCVWPCESVRAKEIHVSALSVQTVQSHIFTFLTDKNQMQSLTRDARLHETILGRDMNYRTEGNLNKMISWIANISCLFFSSPRLFSLVF